MSNEVIQEIEELRTIFEKEAEGIQSPQQLRDVRDKYLSRKKGIITGLMAKLRHIPDEYKAEFGKEVNLLKVAVDQKLKTVEDSLQSQGIRKPDFSLPEFSIPVGRPHLISFVRTQIENIFVQMGYKIVYGYEVESEYNNFDALNIPEHHPARDEQDTFFIKGHPEKVLRTHTSPVQIRYMKKNAPPVKIISPGKVFRKDEPDATHTPVFHQIEGLLIARDISFSHLKGTLEVFLRSFFGGNLNVRFRPGYFPFTEPSAEVDVSCFLCFGNDPGCKICKGTGWLEILGSGMVHPRVLENCGIDSEEFSGFAFGMGIERIAMLKYGISDIRMFYENDLRFINQFG